MKDDLSSLGQHASETAHAGVVEVKSRARRSMDRANEMAGRAGGASCEYIQNKPFTSVGLAFGVGLLLGMLSVRRMSASRAGCRGGGLAALD